jgi:hypothetical protein
LAKLLRKQLGGIAGPFEKEKAGEIWKFDSLTRQQVYLSVIFLPQCTQTTDSDTHHDYVWMSTIHDS